MDQQHADVSAESHLKAKLKKIASPWLWWIELCVVDI